MLSESVCQVAHSWMDVGSFHISLLVRFMIFTVSIQNILDTPWYLCVCLHVYLYRVAQIFHKCGGHLKILGVIRLK
jgi:hypothetical protein